MKKEEIVAKVKELNLPQGSFVVYGSGPLAAAGLREAADIDLMVSKEIFESLWKAGWQELHKAPGDVPLVRDVFEVHENWEFSPYSPTLEELLATATVVDGVPFASLEHVRKWKAGAGRPKDLIDIVMIDNFLSRS